MTKIDSPSAGQRVYDQSIFISGTVTPSKGRPFPRSVRAWIDNVCVGETGIFCPTDPKSDTSEYKFLAKLPEPIDAPRSVVIKITGSVDDEDRAEELGEVVVEVVPARLHERPYGEVVPPDQARPLHRENIYGSGLPVEHPSAEILKLVLAYLAAENSIVDVGCGAGAYGPQLMNAGHNWLGLEINRNCIEILKRRNLPYRELTGAGARFPCADREFDGAICIEVLEHIEDPAPFLGEIARVIRGRALFSVPNMEVLPYFQDWQAVPWHLLEGSHVNFFTRTNLRTLLEPYFSRVEIISHSEHPLRTRDEVPLHAHLLAIAESAPA